MNERTIHVTSTHQMLPLLRPSNTFTTPSRNVTRASSQPPPLPPPRLEGYVYDRTSTRNSTGRVRRCCSILLYLGSFIDTDTTRIHTAGTNDSSYPPWPSAPSPVPSRIPLLLSLSLSLSSSSPSPLIPPALQLLSAMTRPLRTRGAVASFSPNFLPDRAFLRVFGTLPNSR